MDTPDTGEVIRLLTRREQIVRAVGTEGVGKRELVDRLSISRSTVDRGIRDLESAGVLSRSAEGYRRTLFGELLLVEYDSFASTADALCEGHELLSDLPPAFDLDPVVFEDARIVTASQYDPHQPISALCSLLDETRWIQTVFPTLFPQVLDQWTDRYDEESVRADIMLTEPVVSALVAEHSETLQELLDESRLAVHQIREGPTCGLIVAEDDTSVTAGVLVLDSRGGARAFIQTQADEAVSWVQTRIDSQLAQSTPLSTLSL